MASDPTSTKEILLGEIADTIGEHALQTVPPTSAGDPPANPSLPTIKPKCSTQRPTPRNLRNGPADIMVGTKADCPRWIPGSVVRWAAWQNGFDSKADADHAAKHLALATEKWNSYNLGVSFQWVADATDATFVLCHGGDRDTTLAQSFFPNENDLNFFLVYTGAFQGGWKDNMWKVFTHELGHVMGLRHEFAMTPADDGSGETLEEFAVAVGPQNPESVMNYNVPPEIQGSDVKSIKTFYSLKKGAGNQPLKVGLTVVKDCEPR